MQLRFDSGGLQFEKNVTSTAGAKENEIIYVIHVCTHIHTCLPTYLPTYMHPGIHIHIFCK